MKKFLLLFLTIFLSHSYFAQQKGLRIFNENSTKELIIKENQRIRIKTEDGKKVSGRFTFGEEGTIIIEDQQFDLATIQKIKRNPLLLSSVTTAVLLYGGIIITGVAVLIIALVPGAGGGFFLIPAAAMIYAGIKNPNFLRGYSKSNGWQYEMVNIKE